MNTFQRKCPICNKNITYLHEQNFKKAEIKQNKCKSCGIKESITDEKRKEMSRRVKGKNNPMYGKNGKLNPFYGKKHTEESKKKILENRDFTNYKSDEFRKKMSSITKGEKNPMFGRSFYDIWVNKYGEKIANEKLKEYKLKQSKNKKGNKNNMYGKPSPIGSGNGWSGWYKGWYFRSLKELTYMIKIIERFKLKWKSAENKELNIKYKDYKNNERTYSADFLINDKFLVEIKPKKLWNSKIVVLKKESAIKFCNLNNLKYKLTDIEKLSDQEILCLYKNGDLVFTNKYQIKFQKYFK